MRVGLGDADRIFQSRQEPPRLRKPVESPSPSPVRYQRPPFSRTLLLHSLVPKALPTLHSSARPSIHPSPSPSFITAIPSHHFLPLLCLPPFPPLPRRLLLIIPIAFPCLATSAFLYFLSHFVRPTLYHEGPQHPLRPLLLRLSLTHPANRPRTDNSPQAQSYPRTLSTDALTYGLND
ncbi:hypothetical protein S7711_10857 [Stachybotrys chartarum IBT 7711]|uniref:Uncharacterized protein n=1 Tax=Stachybotrys chartarum (strain CBS 109288 / IBT 7711) TaxID=1280523 RepID=A0A084APS0_STACB|nr:hypothetical protein S7711_10857 [Stachybotrys chartarum IBT 7711]